MNNKPSVLVLVGMPGAGKSTCVEHLTAKGIPSVYFGGVIVEEVKKRFGDNGVNETNEKLVREEFREKDGKGAIAKRIIPQIDELLKTNSCVVADGLYSWTEYKMFKERYGNKVLVIAIAAPRYLRHSRLAERLVRPLNEEQATEREYAEIENLEKGGPIANADFTLTNDTDTHSLIAKLEDLLSKCNFN